MAERQANPRDSIDLVLLLQSYGEDIGTLYPRAHVYGPDNQEINGSPFNLTHVANNLYIKSNAFQVGDSGVYKVVYIVYEDSGHTTKSSAHGEQVDIINVKIQSTTGLGGYGSMKNVGGDVIVDLDPVMKVIKDKTDKLEKRIKAIEKTINAGFKIDFPEQKEQDLSPILSKIEKIQSYISNLNNIVYKKDIKKMEEKLVAGIKKNRSTIIKYKFDKGLLKPMIQTIANSDLRLKKGLDDLQVTVAKTIDMKNEEANRLFNKTLDKKLIAIEEGLNILNESIRRKLRATLEGMRTLLFIGKQPKQDIKITLKKDEL